MSDDYYEDLSVGQIHDRGQIIGLGAYWRDERRDYQDDKIIYRGCHHRHNADITDENWEIWKYIWSDGGNVRIEGPLPGAWSKRRSLAWNDFTSVAGEITDATILTRALTEEILIQLKKINLQLSLLTDTEISDGDL